jgi:hypothetical protein
MDNIMEVVSRYALPVTAATVGAMYLDAKHHIVKDVTAWRARKNFQKLVVDGYRRLGDYFTIYHAIEMNDPKADAFWFEQRSWTFGDVRREADKLAQWFLDQGIQTKGMIKKRD